MADTGSSAAAAAAVEVTVDATQPEHVTANVIAAPAPEAKEQVRHVNTCFFLNVLYGGRRTSANLRPKTRHTTPTPQPHHATFLNAVWFHTTRKVVRLVVVWSTNRSCDAVG